MDIDVDVGVSKFLFPSELGPGDVGQVNEPRWWDLERRKIES